MTNPTMKPQFVQLARECVSAIQSAYESLENGGDVHQARSKLKDIARKLTDLEWEYRGCTW